MTNSQFIEAVERMAQLTVAMMRECNGDRTKINEAYWNKMIELYTELEDYI